MFVKGYSMCVRYSCQQLQQCRIFGYTHNVDFLYSVRALWFHDFFYDCQLCFNSAAFCNFELLLMQSDHDGSSQGIPGHFTVVAIISKRKQCNPQTTCDLPHTVFKTCSMLFCYPGVFSTAKASCDSQSSRRSEHALHCVVGGCVHLKPM